MTEYHGRPPIHLVPWAPADYLGSETRMRAMLTKDDKLRWFYAEILSILYVQRGYIAMSKLPTLLAVDAEEVARCVAICIELGSLTAEHEGGCVLSMPPFISEPTGKPIPTDEILLTNIRVLRTIEEIDGRRDRAKAAGGKGAPYGKLGGRPRTRKPPDNPPGGYPKPPLDMDMDKEKEKGKGKETWLTPFGEAWEKVLGGEPSWGVMAREFKPLVERHGAEAVLAGWRRYLAETDPRYVSFASFARKAGVWVKKAPPPKKPKPKLPPATKATMDIWSRTRERIEMPQHLKRTWLSPVEAHSISDTGTLSLIVPSKQHAEAMRRYEAKIVTAFNEENAHTPGDPPPPVAHGVCSIVIEPDDGELHDGGL